MGLADCVRLPFRIRTSTRCWSSGGERLEMYPFIFTPTIQRPDGCIKFWQGETFELLEGVSLIRGGGHFPGGTMLHWAAGAEGKGVVCSADIATVNLDRKSFTFMRSYPNNIPLSAKAVRAIGAALMPLAFDRVYSHHFER